MANTNPNPEKQVKGTYVEDQNLQCCENRMTYKENPIHDLGDTVDEGDQEGPGQSIQRVTSPGQSDVPTIPKNPDAKNEQHAYGEADICGGLSDKLRGPHIKHNQLGPVVKAQEFLQHWLF